MGTKPSLIRVVTVPWQGARPRALPVRFGAGEADGDVNTNSHIPWGSLGSGWRIGGFGTGQAAGVLDFAVLHQTLIRDCRFVSLCSLLSVVHQTLIRDCSGPRIVPVWSHWLTVRLRAFHKVGAAGVTANSEYYPLP